MLRRRLFTKQTFLTHYHLFVALLLARFGPLWSAEFSAPPNRVIGIYKRDSPQRKCGPGIAASFAVKALNKQHRSKHFSYENIQEDQILKLMNNESMIMLNNSIVITEDSYLCELLSSIIINFSSFLVCYGTPTAKMLESLEKHSNIFLTQPNPDAILHCLFKLIKQTIDDKDNTSLATFIYNEDHPFRQVLKHLRLNLRGAYSSYDQIFSEISFSPQAENQVLLMEKQLEHASFINAMLNEKEARNLLCQSILQDGNSSANRSLIFVGLSNRNWLDFNDNQNSYNATCRFQRPIGKKQRQNTCSVPELRTAAEGHLMLEYPHSAWINSANEHIDISLTKSKLREKLQNCSATLTEYEEAPLEFDSVWAVLKAINRASREREDGLVSRESVSQGLVSKAFSGLTGEKISFIKYKNENHSGCVRNTAEATIIIYRFELGEYVPIARHFNTNNSFHWMHPFRPGGRLTWKPNRPECPDFLMQAGRDILMMSLLLSLLLTVLLLGITFLCFQYFRV